MHYCTILVTYYIGQVVGFHVHIPQLGQPSTGKGRWLLSGDIFLKRKNWGFHFCFQIQKSKVPFYNKMMNNSGLTLFIICFDDSKESSVSPSGKNRTWATRARRFSAANKLSSPQCSFLWQTQPSQPLGKPWQRQPHHLLRPAFPKGAAAP